METVETLHEQEEEFRNALIAVLSAIEWRLRAPEGKDNCSIIRSLQRLRNIVDEQAGKRGRG